MTTVHTRRPDSDRTGLTGWSSRAIVAVVVMVFVLFFAIPIVWLLLATTKSAHGLIVENPFRPGSSSDLMANWRQLFAFQDGAVTGWVANSALYAVGALAITLVASIPAGYAMALTEFRLRRLLLVLTLVVMLIPNTALVLPIFLELNVAQLIGNPLSVILPMSFFPFGVYLTYIYFSTSVPRDLLAAARIDGCSEFQVFTTVALPLATPDRRAGRVLQLRAELEQLLPALRDAALQRRLPDPSRPHLPARLDAGVQPQLGWDTVRATSDPGARHRHLGAAGADCLPLLATLPRRGHDGGRHEGMTINPVDKETL